MHGQGWENLDEIMSVPGLSSIAGGPNDLASSLGYPGQPDHPERVAATADIEGRARAAVRTPARNNAPRCLVDWAPMCSQGLLLGGNMNVPGGYETVVRAAELLQGGLREAVRSSKNARL